MDHYTPKNDLSKGYWIAACGALVNGSTDGTAYPITHTTTNGWRPVTCKRCLKTKIFKKHQMHFELSYDGDFVRWCEDWGQDLILLK